MIAVDTNILVYAHREESPFHEPARACVEALASGPGPWAIPWPCVHEFYAVVTHPRIWDPPTPPETALDQIAAWLEAPNLLLLAESPGYGATLRSVVARGRIVGPQIHDARIAALCLHHGVRALWSADRDFGRFPELSVENPLVGS